MEKLLEEQSRLQDQIDAVNAWDLDRTVELAMDALRVPPGDADVGKISGGERRRVALCRLLLPKPDMLLLDEPTNHLDAESVAWLERFLKEYPGTVVAITHDRYFLDNVAGWILELDRGDGIPWEGNYSSWLEQKQAAPGPGGEGRPRPPAHARSASSSGCRCRRARARPRARRGCRRTRQMLDAPFAERAEKLEIAIPAGPAPRRPRGRGRQARQGLRRPRADRRTCRSSCRAAASSASSGPTAPARRRCSA